MARLIAFFAFFGMIGAAEYFTYNGLGQLFGDSAFFQGLYTFSVVLFIFGFFIAISQFRANKKTFWSNFIVGFAFTIFICKLFFVSFLLITNVIFALIAFIGGIISENNGIEALLYRVNLSEWIALIMTAIPFFSMLYGITKGKYQYTVNTVKLKLKNLPSAFNGFRVVQISDIHSGTFDSVNQVEKGIAMINNQDADLFVFTGDLVNFNKDEIDPYINSFSKIQAKHGKFSILGNHDYYGIGILPREQRPFYFDMFKQKHDQIGFNLLRNEHVEIEKDGQKITLIGVENWGIGGFPKTGDLEKAITGSSPDQVNILLSHDPSHWDHVVVPHKRKINLTLSGHTHGMQFGINLPQFKWSPVQYRYQRWMGMYEHEDQYLYVNRGFGFLGFPGRVFMWPEITVFELEQA